MINTTTFRGEERILVAGTNKWVLESAAVFLNKLFTVEIAHSDKNDQPVAPLLAVKKYSLLLLHFSEENEFYFNEIKHIVRNFKNLKILILSSTRNKTYLCKLSQTRVQGILYYGKCGKEDLLHAINDILDQKIYYCKSTAPVLIGNFLKPRLQKSDAADLASLQLSGREYEVLSLISQGYTNNAIGKKLKVSPLTAKNHRKNLMDKMNCKNSAHLVFTACTSGLLLAEKK